MKDRYKIGLALILMLTAQSAMAQGFLDGILNQAEAMTAGWTNTAIQIAMGLFAMLVVIDFTWFAMQQTLKKAEISELLVSLMFKVVAIFFFFTLLVMAPTWIPMISDSFMAAGARISGTTMDQFTPSGILSSGLDAAAQLVNAHEAQQTAAAAADRGLPDVGRIVGGLFGTIIIGLTALIVVIAFAILALQFIVVMLEAMIVMGAGALMLGFSGSKWTMNFAEKYIGYAVSVGAKLLVVALLVGFGQEFADGIIAHWQQLRTATGAAGIATSDYLSIAGGSLIFGAMSFMLPGIAGSFLSGAASMSLSNTAGGMSSAVMPAAGLAAGGAAGAAKLAGAAAGKIATMLAPAGAIAGVASAAAGGAGGAGAMAGAGRAAFAGAPGGGGGALGGGIPGAGGGALGGGAGAPGGGSGAGAGFGGGGAGSGGSGSAGGSTGGSSGFASGGDQAAGGGSGSGSGGAGAGAGAGSSTAPSGGGADSGSGGSGGSGFGNSEGRDSGSGGGGNDESTGGDSGPKMSLSSGGGGGGGASNPADNSGGAAFAGDNSSSSGSSAGFADPAAMRSGSGNSFADSGSQRLGADAGFRDYRDIEASKQKEDRARASAAPMSRNMLKASDKLQSLSRSLSSFASKRRPLSSDGHTGSAPSIRMRNGDD